MTHSIAADLRALAAAKEQMSWLRRERETADGVRRRHLNAEIADLARRITQLQTWIDGGRVA
jgi:hypothetical protein